MKIQLPLSYSEMSFRFCLQKSPEIFLLQARVIVSLQLAWSLVAIFMGPALLPSIGSILFFE